MKLPSLFKNKQQPKSLSFRANDHDESLRSLFIKSARFSSNRDEIIINDQSLETNIGQIRLSERLFFEPEETSSILRKESSVISPFKGSVVHVMESDHPYLDFKKSMQEIVDAQGIILWKDWDCLEKLLGWYLRMNHKMNHGFIVEAFVDLLLGFSANKCSPDTTAYYSSFSSPGDERES